MLGTLKNSIIQAPSTLKLQTTSSSWSKSTCLIVRPFPKELLTAQALSGFGFKGWGRDVGQG